MSTSPISMAIANKLSDLWHLHQSPVFSDYLEEVHKFQLHGEINFNKIYVIETTTGDIVNARCGPKHKHVWEMDDTGLKEINIRERIINDEGPNQSGFFLRPHIFFFIAKDIVVIHEILGQGLFCGKTARYYYSEGKLEFFDIKIIWNCSSIQKTSGWFY